jgi:hypothetical protein
MALPGPELYRWNVMVPRHFAPSTLRHRSWYRGSLLDIRTAQLSRGTLADSSVTDVWPGAVWYHSSKSHEIGTPVNAIRGMVESMEDTSLDPKRKKYLGVMQNNGSATHGS